MMEFRALRFAVDDDEFALARIDLTSGAADPLGAARRGGHAPLSQYYGNWFRGAA